jgi:hypothetical protein
MVLQTGNFHKFFLEIPSIDRKDGFARKLGDFYRCLEKGWKFTNTIVIVLTYVFFQRIRVNWMFLIRRPPSADACEMMVGVENIVLDL